MLEPLVETAAKRISYELGTQDIIRSPILLTKPLQVMLPDFRYKAESNGIVENEICPVLVGVVRHRSIIKLNSEEVASKWWYDWDKFLEHAYERKPLESGLTLSQWSLLEAKALNESQDFQNWFKPNR